MTPDLSFLQEKKWSLGWTASAPAIQLFAQLTGDFNPLHVDEQFAARSAYRKNIAHGMLGILHIAALPICQNSAAHLKKISASFHKPANAGEQLRLETELKKFHEASLEADFQFSIVRGPQSVVLTKGSFTLQYSSIVTKNALSAPQSPPLNTPAQRWTLADLKEGTSEQFIYSLSSAQILQLQDIWKQTGIGEGLMSDAIAPYFVATSLLSTYVGMYVPGERATFLGFSLAFKNSAHMPSDLRVQGQVTAQSLATSSVLQKVTISDAQSNQPWAEAQISAKVQRSSPQMPSTQEIRQTSSSLGLQDKVVLVTGASRGIGETIAKLFAVQGARVILNYHRSQEAAQAVLKDIQSAGFEAIAIQADISQETEVSRLIQQTIQHYGRVDVLINNAVGDALSTPFLELQWPAIEAEIQVSLKGVFHLCQNVIPYMKKNGGGKIINVSTTYVDAPPPHMLKYVLVKSALVGMSRSLAVEFAKDNIQVNLVSPSIVETDLTQNVSEDFLEQAKMQTPMGRNASALDVAHAVLTLASQFSSFTTGQRLVVAGGQAPFL